ncbi:MAG: LacI family DNA-binding transcriptional regulator [Gemmiger sp.]|nr:LacI family DNA-binding transcriptional regulator [Gemmiger sp.]
MVDSVAGIKGKKVTVATVAATAGVSPATVSRVLNCRGIVKEETSARVLDAVKALGYTLPEAPATHEPEPERDSGLILLNVPSFSNPFYEEVIQGAHASVRQRGYTMMITESHINNESVDAMVSLLKRYRVAGLITLNQLETPLCRRLNETVPLVQCSEYNQEVDTPYISVDNVSAARSAVSHLISLGRRKVAFLNGPIRYQYARTRLKGYCMALTDAGIPYDPSYVVSLPDILIDFSISAMMQLLSLPDPPDAVFCASDVYAISVLRACHLAGLRVPEDVALVGFDNMDVTKCLVPSVSTVSQPRTQLGFLAAEALFEKMTMPDAPNKKTLLDTELIIRESSTLRALPKCE